MLVKASSRRAGEICAFLNVPPEAADRTKAHSYTGIYVKTPLDDLDPAYLCGRADQLEMSTAAIRELIAEHSKRTE